MIYSALALEAGANEAGEKHWLGEQLDAFWRCRAPFERPKGERIAEVRWKWRWIFVELAQNEAALAPLFDEIQWLMELRNDLVHYKVSPTSSVVFQKPLTVDRHASGRVEIWNADWPVADVKLGVMDRVLDSETSARSVRVATEVFSYWNELQSKRL